MSNPEVKFKYDTSRKQWRDARGEIRMCASGVRKFMHTRGETRNTLVAVAYKTRRPGSLKFAVTVYGEVMLGGTAIAVYLDVEDKLRSLQQEGYKYLNFYWEDAA